MEGHLGSETHLVNSEIRIITNGVLTQILPRPILRGTRPATPTTGSTNA